MLAKTTTRMMSLHLKLLQAMTGGSTQKQVQAHMLLLKQKAKNSQTVHLKKRQGLLHIIQRQKNKARQKLTIYRKNMLKSQMEVSQDLLFIILTIL